MSNHLLQQRVSRILESLEETFGKCHDVSYLEDAPVEQSAAFIVGWTKSSLKLAIEDLQRVRLELINNSIN